MNSFRISYLPDGERDKHPRGADVTWEKLARILGQTGVDPSPCTLETCGTGEHELLVEKKGKLVSVGCRHKYREAWSPAAYPPGVTRGKRAVGSVGLLVIDLDHITNEHLRAVATRLAPYRYIAHGSHSDQRPRVVGPGEASVLERAVRIVLPLSEPVLGVDWPRFWEAAMHELGLGDKTADTSCCDASRLYFLPSRRSDCVFLFSTNEGAALDVRAILAKARPADPTSARDDLGEFGSASLDVLADAMRALKARGPAIEGKGGDTHTYSVCATLVHDYALTEAEAWPLLAAWNRTCSPPWDEDELRTKLENARQYADGVRGAARAELESADLLADVLGVNETPPTADETPADVYPSNVLDVLGSLIGDAPAAPEPGTWEHTLAIARRDVVRSLGEDKDGAGSSRLFVPAREILDKDFGPTPWTVERLLVDGSVAVLVGGPKSTKSWLALDMAMCVSSGHDVVGRFRVPTPKKAAYFFAEDVGQSVQSRMAAFEAGRGLARGSMVGNLFVQPCGEHIDLTRNEDLARIIASCREIGQLGLLVLDPLRDIHTGKENESDDMGQVFKRLRLLRSVLGCAVVVNHHARGKGGKEQEDTRAGDDIRGSTAIFGALDVVISMRELVEEERESGSKFTAKVKSTVRGARSAGTFSLSLTIDDNPTTHTAERAVWEYRSLSAQKANETEGKLGAVAVEDKAIALLEFLALCDARAEPPPTSRKMLDGLKPCGQSTMYAAIACAQAKSWIQRTERGTYKLTALGRDLLRERAAGE